MIIDDSTLIKFINNISMEIEQRLERLESKDAIKELASKYALALDVRDLDSLVNLFHEDVRVGKKGRGRLALKQWFNEISSGSRGFLSHAKDEFSELFYDQNINCMLINCIYSCTIIIICIYRFHFVVEEMDGTISRFHFRHQNPKASE